MLAVQGFLVPQNLTAEVIPVSEDEAGLSVGPASDKALSINVERLPLRTPESWSWVPVSTVTDTRLGKMLDKHKNRGEPRKYLRNTNVHWFRFELESIKTMLLEDSEVNQYLLQDGDILICEGGHGIARTAVWSGQIPGIVFQKALHRVRPFSCLNPHFFSYCMWCYERMGILKDYYTGAGIPHFTGRALARLPLPLPPREEQDRIVSKVNQLMVIIDQLARQRRRKRQVAEAFAQATVSAITGTASQDTKPMKAPKTELVTRLQVDRSRNCDPGDAAPLALLLAAHGGELSAKALWQHSALVIDAFYRQLKTEMAAGWISEPEPALMREIESD